MIGAHRLKFYGDLRHSVAWLQAGGVERRRGEQTGEQRSEQPFDVSGTQPTVISHWGTREKVGASQSARQ